MLFIIFQVQVIRAIFACGALFFYRSFVLVGTGSSKVGFFAANANQFRAPFLDLKPLNSDFLQTIVEFKAFGFVGMAFRRLALGISSPITTCFEDSSSRIAPKFSADGRRMYSDLLDDFILTPTRFEQCLN